MAARGTRRPHSRRPRPVPMRRVSKGGGGGKSGGCALILFFAGLALMASAAGAWLALRGGA